MTKVAENFFERNHRMSLADTDLLGSGPVVIGGTGGSGTRVFARLVRQGGLFIGTELNYSEDAVHITDFQDRWINVILSQDSDPPSEWWRTQMVLDLRAAVTSHCTSFSDNGNKWGWKEPRSIYLLPFLHSQFPALKFLHVVRDGRDMAFSSNQNQLRKYGDLLLDSETNRLSEPLRSIALWNQTNMRAADYGEDHLRSQYLRVRFEDLCAEPVAVVRQVLDFLALEGSPEEIANAQISVPSSIGCWRTQHHDIVDKLNKIGGPALRRFGY